MSVMLVGGGGRTLCLASRVWAQVLGLALDQGWRPAGTKPPSEDSIRAQAPEWTDAAIEQEVWRLEATWDGGYESADGQLVTADDAFVLSEALARAAASVTDEDGAAWQRVLVDIADLCAEGGFEIW